MKRLKVTLDLEAKVHSGIVFVRDTQQGHKLLDENFSVFGVVYHCRIDHFRLIYTLYSGDGNDGILSNPN